MRERAVRMVREYRREYSALWATIEFTVTDFLENSWYGLSGAGEGSRIGSEWAISGDVDAQLAPGFDVDQRNNW